MALNPIGTFQAIRLSYFIKCHLSSSCTYARKRKPFSICKNLIHCSLCPTSPVMILCIAENSICLYVPWMCSYLEDPLLFSFASSTGSVRLTARICLLMSFCSRLFSIFPRFGCNASIWFLMEMLSSCPRKFRF